MGIGGMDVGFPNMSRELNTINIICLESKSPNPLNGKTSGLNGPKLVDPAPSMGSSSSRAIGAAFPGPRDSTGKGTDTCFQVYFSTEVGVRLGGRERGQERNGKDVGKRNRSGVWIWFGGRRSGAGSVFMFLRNVLNNFFALEL